MASRKAARPKKPLNKVTRTKAPAPAKIEQYQIGISDGGYYDDDIRNYDHVFVVDALTSAEAAFVALAEFRRRFPKEKVTDIKIEDDPENEIIFVPYTPPAPPAESGPAAVSPD